MGHLGGTGPLAAHDAGAGELVPGGEGLSRIAVGVRSRVMSGVLLVTS